MAEPRPGLPSDLSTTTDLLRRARMGDREALDALFSRHLGPLRRWARGRLPRWTRDLRDTEDLVQETMAQTLRHVDDFEPRHEGALRAYLRQAVLNRIRDEVRRVSRTSVAPGLGEAAEVIDPAASPLDEAIGRESVARYEAALQRLRAEDRELIIARLEMQQSYAEIAAMNGKRSADAARMAVARAVVKLIEEMDAEK